MLELEREIFRLIDKRGQMLLSSLYKHTAKFCNATEDDTRKCLQVLMKAAGLCQSKPRGNKQKVIVFFSKGCEDKREAYRSAYGGD